MTICKNLVAALTLLLIPDDIRKWIEHLKEAIASKKPTQVVCALVQIGVDSPHGGKCNCEESEMEDPTLRWLHENHRRYNREIWQIIMEHAELLPKLRRVLLDDLKTLSQSEEEDRAKYKENFGKEASENPHYKFVSYGKLVRHDYARAILDHFLWADPQKADWI